MFLILIIFAFSALLSGCDFPECKSHSELLNETTDGVKLYKYYNCAGEDVYFSAKGTKWETHHPYMIGKNSAIRTEKHQVPNAD